MNKVICGNCLEVMREFPDESIDLILTSPPYNVGLNYDDFNDNLSNEEHMEFSKKWLTEAYRVSSNGTRAYFIIGDRMVWWFREIAEEAGWKFVQFLLWCKPNLVGGGKVSMEWTPMTENILMFRKGKRVPMLNSEYSRTFNWFVETVPQSNYKEGRIHPAQLPIGLCVQLIARTPGNTVLDPFSGSGQVLRAAKALGRNYIGIELVPSVVEKSKNLISMPVDLDKIAQKEKKWR